MRSRSQLLRERARIEKRLAEIEAQLKTLHEKEVSRPQPEGWDEVRTISGRKYLYKRFWNGKRKVSKYVGVVNE
jgi:hypothetical protein